MTETSNSNEISVEPTTIRFVEVLSAIPIKITKETNTIRFTSFQEKKNFDLVGNETLIAQIELYKEIDIEIQVTRNELGIISGNILKFKKLEQMPGIDAINAWYEWYYSVHNE